MTFWLWYLVGSVVSVVFLILVMRKQAMRWRDDWLLNLIATVFVVVVWPLFILGLISDAVNRYEVRQHDEWL